MTEVLSDDQLLSLEKPKADVSFAPEESAPAQKSEILSDDQLMALHAQHRPEEAPQGILTRTEDDGYGSGALKGAATATIHGLSSIPGTAGNIRDFGRYGADRAVGAITGATPEEIEKKRIKGYDEDLADWIGEKTGFRPRMPNTETFAAPIEEKTGRYDPDTVGGKIAQGALEAGIGAMGPGSGVLKAGAKAGPAIAETIAPKAAALNMLGGGAGAGVTDITGDPLYGFGASVLSGGAAHAGEAGFNKFGKPIKAQFSKGARDAQAAEQLLGYAHDPEALKQSLVFGDAQGPVKDQIVPGSPLTLGQRYGDTGILQAERSFRSDPEFGSEINKRESQQNEARHQALADVPKDTAVTTDLPNAVRDRHTTITQRYEQAEAALYERAQREMAALGERADPSEIGQRLREDIQKSRDAEKKDIDKLYDEVDPNGDMSLLTSPVQKARDAILADKGAFTEHSPELTGVLNRLENLQDVHTFKDVRDLDRLLSEKMSAERRANGETTSWRHLAALKGATKEAINKAIENQIAWENAAVKEGKLRPEDTLEGRLGQSDPRAAAAGEAAASAGEGDESVRQTAGGDRPVPPASGNSRQEGSGPGNVNGGAGLSQKVPTGGHKVYYPGGNVDVQHQVVDLNDLTISHNSDFTENPKFPQELQPRDRSGKPAQDQVLHYTNNLNPDQLGISAEANTGAPVVGPDGVVESGNGRSMAIRNNYAKGDPRGYRKWLESQGYDTTGIKNPVLIARRTSELTPSQREYFTQNANSKTGLAMNAVEQGAADAKFLTPEVLSKLEMGDVNSAANAAFVNEVMSKLPVNERGDFGTSDGKLSQSGVQRLKAAIMSRAFGSDDIVRRGFESTDNNIRNVTGALSDIAGPWAQMRAAAEAGHIAPNHDVTKELIDAVHKIMRARDEGRPVSEVIKQNDMFGGDTPELVAKLLFNGDRVAGRQAIAERLQRYAVEALKNESGPGLFGDTVTPDDILKTVGGKGGEEPAPEAPKVEEKQTDTGTFEAGANEPPPGTRPNMEPGQADKLKTANKRYGEYAQTYKNGQVRDVLKTTGFKDQYSVQDSAVAGRAVKPGDTGLETATRFLKAAKNGEGAVSAMKEAVLNKFRDLVKPDGTMDARKFATVRKSFDGAIQAIDKVSPGFAQSLENPAKAAESMAAFCKNRKEALDALQKEAASKFLGLHDPVEIENAVGKLIDGQSVTRVRDVVKDLPPDAVEGMRKAAVDWILRAKTNVARPGVGETRALSYAKLDTMLKNKRPMLEAIFTPEQMSVLDNVNRDLMLSDRSVQATKDRTNTSGSGRAAADHLKAAGSDIANMTVGGILYASVAEGFHTGGLFGALKIGVPAALVKLGMKMRASGMQSVNDVVKQAMLDPEFARELLNKVPVRNQEIPQGWADKIQNAIHRTIYRSYLSGVPVMQDEQRKARATGGRIGRSAMTPDQLITALERTRKDQQKSTEVILSKPDATVVRALDIASQQL